MDNSDCPLCLSCKKEIESSQDIVEIIKYIRDSKGETIRCYDSYYHVVCSPIGNDGERLA